MIRYFLLISIIIFELLFTNLLGFSIYNCSSSGCNVSSNILAFDKSYLQIIAIIASVLLLTLNYFKKEFLYSKLLSLVFISESILFIFLLIFYNVFCLECFIFYSILIFLIIENKNKIIIAPIIIAGTLLLLSPMKSLDNFEYILITKEGCSHCIKVKKFITDNNIKKIKISSVEENRHLLKLINMKHVPILVLQKENVQFIKGDINIIKKLKKDFLNNENKNEALNLSESIFDNSVLPLESESFGCQVDKIVCLD